MCLHGCNRACEGFVSEGILPHVSGHQGHVSESPVLHLCNGGHKAILNTYKKIKCQITSQRPRYTTDTELKSMNLGLHIQLSGNTGPRCLNIHMALLRIWIQIPKIYGMGPSSETSFSKKYLVVSTTIWGDMNAKVSGWFCQSFFYRKSK